MMRFVHTYILYVQGRRSWIILIFSRLQQKEKKIIQPHKIEDDVKKKNGEKHEIDSGLDFFALEIWGYYLSHLK